MPVTRFSIKMGVDSGPFAPCRLRLLDQSIPISHEDISRRFFREPSYIMKYEINGHCWALTYRAKERPTRIERSAVLAKDGHPVCIAKARGSFLEPFGPTVKAEWNGEGGEYQYPFYSHRRWCRIEAADSLGHVFLTADTKVKFRGPVVWNCEAEINESSENAVAIAVAVVLFHLPPRESSTP